jgi:hypothetical protein
MRPDYDDDDDDEYFDETPVEYEEDYEDCD